MPPVLQVFTPCVRALLALPGRTAAYQGGSQQQEPLAPGCDFPLNPPPGGFPCLQEIHEYLDPATGVMDLSAEAASRQANAALVKDVQLSPIASEDIEKGLAAPAPGYGGREGGVRRGSVVHVDASESLTAASGAAMPGRSPGGRGGNGGHWADAGDSRQRLP